MAMTEWAAGPNWHHGHLHHHLSDLWIVGTPKRKRQVRGEKRDCWLKYDYG